MSNFWQSKLIERDKLFTTRCDVLSSLPSEWLPLFKGLGKSVEFGELWYREQTSSQYAQPPLWHTLLNSFLTCNPTIVSGNLSFKPRFLLLPSHLQERFLKFLLTQSSKVADAVIKEFLLGIARHVSLQEETSIVGLIRELSIQAKCEQQVFISNQQDNAVGEVKTSKDILVPNKSGPQLEVIVLDADSDKDQEPATKRRRLEEPEEISIPVAEGSPSPKPMIVLEPRPKPVTEAEDSPKPMTVSEASPKHPEDDDDFLDLTDQGASHSLILSSQQVSLSFIDNDKGANVAAGSTTFGTNLTTLKDIWYNVLTENSLECLECLNEITQLSSTEMENFCKFVKFDSMTDESIELSCQHICTISDAISYGNTVVFLQSVLGNRIKHLSQNASRKLVGAIIQTAHVFPKQLTEAVLVPSLMLSELSPGQTELISRVVKETFSNSTRGFLMHILLQNGIEINDSKLQVLQTLLECGCDFMGQDMSKFVAVLNASSGAMTKNLKFSKLLLAVVTEYGDLVKSNLSELEAVLDKHSTFMKKKILAALSKLKAQ